MNKLFLATIAALTLACSPALGNEIKGADVWLKTTHAATLKQASNLCVTAQCKRAVRSWTGPASVPLACLMFATGESKSDDDFWICYDWGDRFLQSAIQ